MRCLTIWEPDTSIPDKRTLIDAVATYLSGQGLVGDRCAAAEALRLRESLGDTLIAPHLAIPHAMSDAVNESVVLFVKLRDGLDDWQPGATVDRYLFTLIPERPPTADLEAIKSLYTRLADDRTLEALAGGGPSDVLTVLQQERN
ncbi:PTS sugar transporter subunit IIA [Bifidobacterium scardovii]|uniref:Phosphoenolpyruvate-dependent sugar PTS family porter, EIIA 2 n=1 Tax=Bifidobacterium scardovii TaxID=158787 RepID=A0A087D782_9BIFI|nr:PTS sugar transporter subunit IIA [Bifidobacterium scardovii]KFI91382.1 phosphoenolpyruvate-dependent sugar PTS family porter, EIIA 2 [Bifidobacterium scardovii]MDK6349584.1 PTS sugar transporter subunit IIA [Bifidobacterium scardovii]MDU8981765.1 PTS sugar transporter subunit IIA [Bifidobacterium scardovii]BAQ30860.1 hypothetical protein BBSC_0780 [Bifidobacterium scardovii JCM 12489 = DSM 13734]